MEARARLQVASNAGGAWVVFSASPYDDYAEPAGAAWGARGTATEAFADGPRLQAVASGGASTAGPVDAAAMTDGFVFLSNSGASMATVSFLFF